MKTIRMMMWPVWGAATALMMSTTAQAANQTLEVSWEVAQSSCEIGVQSEIPLEVVDVTKILSGANWQHVGDKKFNITVNDCNAGYTPGTGTRPSVRVEGKTAGPTAYSRFLFKDDGDSVGLYIILLKAAASAGSVTTDQEVTNGETLWIPNNSGGGYVPAGSTLASGTPYTIPLTAAVACGRVEAAGCQNPNIRAGELGARFTFVFDYR